MMIKLISLMTLGRTGDGSLIYCFLLQQLSVAFLIVSNSVQLKLDYNYFPKSSECVPKRTNSIISVLGSIQINRKSPWT